MNSIEEIRQRLVDGDLLSAAEADEGLTKWRDEIRDYLPDAPPEDFVDWLIEHGRITEFQGDAICAGHTAPFMLGPYTVYEHIAAGRLGGMYRGVQEEFNQPVSLKIFPSSLNDEQLARLGREARIFAELDHANVLRSFEVGRVGNVHYMALEELRGETLAALLEREQRLPYERACAVMRDVARGLQHLHDNEVVHRDLRPENIWVQDNGAAKLFEFGAARDAFASVDTTADGEALTRSDSVVGEYAYMAPEQAQDPCDADHSSDIYALGCVLYHCLAGHPVFTDKNDVKLVLKHVNTVPPRISELIADVPNQVDETLASLLAKVPADRFKSAGDVAFALDQYAKDDAVETVEIVGVSQQYFDWIQSKDTNETTGISEDAVAMTPELTEFLSFMGTRSGPRKRRSASTR